MVKKKTRKYGFAETKRYPGKRHPAYYKKIDSDKIEYVTFTKHDPANIDGEKVSVKKLSHNINPSLRGKTPSNVVERVYVGKRSALHKNKPEYSFFNKSDEEIVLTVLKNAPRIEVKYTSNSKSKKKRK